MATFSDPELFPGYSTARKVLLTAGTVTTIAAATWALSCTVSECGVQSLENPVPTICSIFDFWWRQIDHRYGITDGEAPWAFIFIMVATFLVAGLDFLSYSYSYLLITRGPWVHIIGPYSLAWTLVQEQISALRQNYPVIATLSRCFAASVVNEGGHRLYTDDGIDCEHPFRFVITDDYRDEVPNDEVNPEKEDALAVLQSIDYELVPNVTDVIKVDNDYFELVATDCIYCAAQKPLYSWLEVSMIFIVVVARFLVLNFLAFVFVSSILPPNPPPFHKLFSLSQIYFVHYC